jgi:hypothetical protein
MQMTKGTNGWVCGNLVFGMIPGLIVDLATGAIKKLEPAQIVAELNRSGAVSAADTCSGSVTGGYMYRGSELTGLQGLYFWGDFCDNSGEELPPFRRPSSPAESRRAARRVLRTC